MKYEIICDNKEIDWMFYIIKFDILVRNKVKIIEKLLII